MDIDYQDGNEGLRRISLAGRLDIEGTDAIATKFAALAASAKHQVVVDLRKVTFLASIGIRALIANAKAQQQRGGRMVLLVNEDDAVERSLESTGMEALLPMFSDPQEADRAALA